MERITAKEAQFPLPFPQRLEYNAPVHGTWNIVHISMLVPEAHSIYVCSDNCMRGVVMTAAEMGCRDRFSCVTLSERDVMTDNLESITIEGAAYVIDHLEKRPPVIFLFLVCLHVFVASDEAYILKKLRERYPDICFVRCYMDCVRQKTGPTPDMKLRGFVYEPLRVREKIPGRVNVLGCDVAYGEKSELISRIRNAGCSAMQLQDCRTYEEYQQLACSVLNICTYMNAQSGVKELSERMGCRYLYLPPAAEFEEIREAYRQLDEALEEAGAGESRPSEKAAEMEKGAARQAWCGKQEMLCRDALSRLKERLEEAKAVVSIDYTCHPRPLGIAKLLIRAGIRVRRVYLDAMSEEEQGAFDWLQEHAPGLELVSTVRPLSIRTELEASAGETGAASREHPACESCRARECDRRVLALGQKAAWFEQTEWFVNMIEGGGLWGYEGIRGLCREMEKALDEAKDLRDIVPRKGLGWPSLCDVPGGACV